MIGSGPRHRDGDPSVCMAGRVVDDVAQRATQLLLIADDSRRDQTCCHSQVGDGFESNNFGVDQIVEVDIVEKQWYPALVRTGEKE